MSDSSIERFLDNIHDMEKIHVMYFKDADNNVLPVVRFDKQSDLLGKVDFTKHLITRDLFQNDVDPITYRWISKYFGLILKFQDYDGLDPIKIRKIVTTTHLDNDISQAIKYAGLEGYLDFIYFIIARIQQVSTKMFFSGQKEVRLSKILEVNREAAELLALFDNKDSIEQIAFKTSKGQYILKKKDVVQKVLDWIELGGKETVYSKDFKEAVESSLIIDEQTAISEFRNRVAFSLHRMLKDEGLIEIKGKTSNKECLLIAQILDYGLIGKTMYLTNEKKSRQVRGYIANHEYQLIAEQQEINQGDIELLFKYFGKELLDGRQSHLNNANQIYLRRLISRFGLQPLESELLIVADCVSSFLIELNEQIWELNEKVNNIEKHLITHNINLDQEGDIEEFLGAKESVVFIEQRSLIKQLSTEGRQPILISGKSKYSNMLSEFLGSIDVSFGKYLYIGLQHMLLENSKIKPEQINLFTGKFFQLTGIIENPGLTDFEIELTIFNLARE